AFSFVCVHHAPGQAHLHCFGFSYCPCQSLGSSHTRSDTQVYFGLPKFRLFTSANEVAHHCQFTATAERIPLNCVDNRGTQCRSFIPLRKPIHLVPVYEPSRC